MALVSESSRPVEAVGRGVFINSANAASSPSPAAEISKWAENGAVLDRYDTSLQSYWKMEEDATPPGTRFDQLGNNDLAQVGDPGNRVGKVGNAANLPGASEYLHGTVARSSIFALSLWVYIDTDESGFGHSGIFSFAGGADAYYIRHSADTPGSRDEFEIIQSDLTHVMVNTAVRTPIQTWTHIVLIADGSKIYLYRNNVDEGSATYDGTIQNTDGIFQLSRIEDLAPFYDMDGAIDETALWNDISFANDAARLAFVDALYNDGDGVTYTQ